MRKLSDGYYQKLVADTLTKSELKKLAGDIVDLQNRKPIIVERIIIKPEYIEKEIDGVKVDKDSVYIEDYYPNKESPFLKYSNRFSLKSEKGISQFEFDSINLSAVITQRKDGLFEADIKGPEFLKISNVDIQSIPLTPEKPDNFGILMGVDYGVDFKNKTNFINVSSYIRNKKFYIGGGVNTNGQFSGGVKYEF